MTIRLEEDNIVYIPLASKLDSGIYNMELTYLQDKTTQSIRLEDNTPLNRFASFQFSGQFKEGSYTYTILADEEIVRRGLAFSGTFTTNESRKEYNSNKNTFTYE